MPARYEAMRDAFHGQGLSLPAAKTKAAKIYNATRKPTEPTLAGAVKREKKSKQS